MQKIAFGLLLSSLLFLSGCETNPVTGKRELSLVSTQQEISIGQKQYAPSQQSQGGQYTIDPAVNAYINKVGQRLAKLSDQPNLPYEFVVLNSGIPNAWALPGGKIAINRGLLVLLEDEAQLAAVLGHEVVHAAARHGASQMSRGTLFQLGTQIVAQATDNGAYTTLAGLGASAANAKYGRDDELEADFYGINYMVKAGYDPQAAVELQQKLLALSNGQKSSWLDSFFASHPPSEERVSKNQQRANILPKGTRNKAAYQKAIAQISKDKKAYALHDEAMKKVSKKEWDKALSLTKKAIKQQPKEARFHILQGQILDQKKQHKASIKAFDTAAKLEPNYFAPYFYRGISQQENKQYDAARKDLLKSTQYLNTSVANYYLGEIALEKNEKDSAITYYKKAAQAGGKAGSAAVKKLKEMGAIK